ncbi:MAG: hypothetical protein K0U84_24215 [Actinomycetia bacterium]|nr:hypothetical protein [Actinomycetes bacterium]
MSDSQPLTPGSLPPVDGQRPDTPKVDPFDPARFRVDSIADIGVEKILTTVSVRKPKRTEFFRVHPGSDFSYDMALLERSDGMDRESYLVDPAVQHLVSSELRPVRLYVVINKHGGLFLWPVKLPSDERDRLRHMADSALRAAEQAKTLWTKIVWEKHLGAWEMYRAKGDLGEPQWPEKSFAELLAIAFRSFLIDRPDHEVIRELAGEL